MIEAVFDANLLVSAFLSRDRPGSVTNELIRLVIAGARLQVRYAYTPGQVGQYRADLSTLARIVEDPSPTPGAVPRDPDDKIIACAVAAGVQYLVSRDRDLLSLGGYAGITIIAPEPFLRLVRAQS
jgi:predicted nucleic acid-binding protein